MIFCEKSTTFYGTLAIVCIINDFLWKIIILNDYVPNKSYKDLFNHLTKKESSLQLQVIINIKKTDNINSVQSSRTSDPLWVTLYISFSAKDSFHFDADPDLDPGHKHFFKNYWFVKHFWYIFCASGSLDPLSFADPTDLEILSTDLNNWFFI